MSARLRTFGIAAALGALVALRAWPAGAAPPARPEPAYDGKPLSAWLAQLKSAGAREREQAADALARMPHAFAAAVPAILDAAMHTKAEPNSQAVALLARLGPFAVPALTQAAWDDSPQTRRVAVYVLGKIGSDALPATPTLAHALKDPDPVVRRLAMEALVQAGAYSAVPRLRDLLEDPDGVVQVRAARALVRLEAEARPLLPVLVRGLAEDDPDVGGAAADGLARLGPEAAPAAADLAKLLPGILAERRRPLVGVLQEIGPAAAGAVPALKRLAREHPELRGAVAKALWSIAQDRDAPAMLLAYLREAPARERPEAAIALWQMAGSPEAVAALVRSAGEADPEVAGRAVDLLGQVGPGAKEAVPALAKLLTRSPGDLRSRAAHALGDIGSVAAAALPALARAAKDDDPGAGVVAVAAVCQIRPDRAAVLALAGNLKAKRKRDLRRFAARALGLLGKVGEPAVPALKAALADPDDEVRLAAAVALWEIGRAPEALPAAAAVLRSPDPAVRSEAALEVGAVWGPDARPAVPALARLLWDVDSSVPTRAAEARGRVGAGAKAAAPALAAVLDGTGYFGNLSAACEALGQIGPPAKAGVPALERQLAHPSKLVRVHAALALWLIAGDRAGEGELAPALADRDYRTRIMAAEALWRMRRDGRTVPVLLRALRDLKQAGDPDWNNEAYMAARALGRIGPAAREAVPALTRLRSHYDPYVARAAAEALRRIGPPAGEAGPP